MALKILQLNENKPEVVPFGPPNSINLINKSLGNLYTYLKPHSMNLGVICDCI